MNKCSHCNIIVYDETSACPFCRRVLDEVSPDDISCMKRQHITMEGSPYPDLRKKAKTLRFAMRLVLFLFILAEAILIAVNIFATPNFFWSGITGMIMIYSYLSMIYWIKHDAGYAMKVGRQLSLTIAVLIGVDYFTGMTGWSLQWAIPGVVLAADAVVFLLMLLNRQYWFSYTLLLFLIGIISVVIMGLYHAGIIHNIVLPVISLLVTGFYLLGTVIFGDREFSREMKRRFHV